MAQQLFCIFFCLALFIQTAQPQEIFHATTTLTPLLTSSDGAQIQTHHREVTIVNNSWNVNILSQNKWQFIVFLDSRWGFYPDMYSSIQITINSPSNTAASSLTDWLAIGITTDNEEYISSLISMKNTKQNQIYPLCDTSSTSTQTHGSGDIASMLSIDRTCDIADGSCSNWNDMLPQHLPNNINSFPITFQLENKPQTNSLLLSFSTKTYTNRFEQQCGFIASPTDRGLKVYIGGDAIGQSYKIKSIQITATNEITTDEPSTNPTQTPTNLPTISPIYNPTISPSKNPSIAPTIKPTQAPSDIPTNIPSSSPTVITGMPSLPPTRAPSYDPTVSPTCVPSYNPTISPTLFPTLHPTAAPSEASLSPTITSAAPSMASNGPSVSPTMLPSNAPTEIPTTISPTFNPTEVPTSSYSPSFIPTVSPTAVPSEDPSHSPSEPATLYPITMYPSDVPSAFPVRQQTVNAILHPTTERPTTKPTEEPTITITNMMEEDEVTSSEQTTIIIQVTDVMEQTKLIWENSVVKASSLRNNLDIIMICGCSLLFVVMFRIGYCHYKQRVIEPKHSVGEEPEVTQLKFERITSPVIESYLIRVHFGDKQFDYTLHQKRDDEDGYEYDWDTNTYYDFSEAICNAFDLHFVNFKLYQLEENIEEDINDIDDIIIAFDCALNNDEPAHFIDIYLTLIAEETPRKHMKTISEIDPRLSFVAVNSQTSTTLFDVHANYEEVTRTCQRIIRTTQDSREKFKAYQRLGYVEERKGNFQKAMKYYRRALNEEFDEDLEERVLELLDMPGVILPQVTTYDYDPSKTFTNTFIGGTTPQTTSELRKISSTFEIYT